MLFYREFSKRGYLKILLTILFIILAYGVGGLYTQYLYESIPLGVHTGDYLKTFRVYYGNNMTLFATVLPWAVAFLAALVGARVILNWKISQLFSVNETINFRKIGYAALIWFLINTIVLTFFTNSLVWIFNPEKFFYLLMISIVFITAQCIAEEFLFRTFLVKLIGRAVPVGWFIALMTGAVFGLLHATNPEVQALGKLAMIYYIGAGLVLGLLVIVDNGIELTTGFHIANNLSAALIVTTDWQVFQTDALFKDISEPHVNWQTFIILFASLALFVYLMHRKFDLKKGLYRLGKNV